MNGTSDLVTTERTLKTICLVSKPLASFDETVEKAKKVMLVNLNELAKESDEFYEFCWTI